MRPTMCLLASLPLAAALASLSSTRAVYAQSLNERERPLPEVAGPRIPVEERFVSKGTPLFQWLFGNMPADQVADAMVVRVDYPDHWNWNRDGSIFDRWEESADRTHKSEAGTGAKAITYTPDPTPPGNGSPGYLGETLKTQESCVSRSRDTGGLPIIDYGRGDYEWVYRYTRDTNNDGKADADPKWVLEKTGFAPYTTQQQAQAFC
jgi:hypothetical protein